MARTKDVKKTQSDEPVSLFVLAQELGVPLVRLQGMLNTGTIMPVAAGTSGLLLFRRKPVEQFLRFAGDID